MRPNQKIQMCPYCEGFIDAKSDECHYCGSELKKEAESSAYRPLYAVKEEVNQMKKNEVKPIVVPPLVALSLFVLGSFLLTFSFLVLIFASNGKIVLEFRVIYTIFYFFVGALAFIFGLRHLKK